MAITLSGAIGSNGYTLDYDSAAKAYDAAKLLIASIDATYSTAVVYSPGEKVPHTGVLLVGDAVANNRISTAGFSIVIDENNTVSSTVVGGGNQTILGGDGGMWYRNDAGNVVVDLGGGNNHISLLGDTGTGAIYIGGGNNTIVAGYGAVSIDAGTGNNRDVLGAGDGNVTVSGHDTIRLGSGSDTIDVMAGGSAKVGGAASVSGSGYSLVFVNADQASTVAAGAGRYSIFGGAGGGLYRGGSEGGNYIQGGTGNITMQGGGAGDTLLGGTGSNLIIAGSGNETLGGAGFTTFDLNTALTHNTGGLGGTVDTLLNFGGSDLLQLSGGAAAIAQALSTYDVTGGSGSFFLQDGTKVVLEGYSGSLSADNFKH